MAVKIAETLNIDSLKNYNLVVTVTRSLRVGGDVIKKKRPVIICFNRKFKLFKNQ